MPNIKQQKRRVQIAARQRLENLRYRSTAKTLYKRLETAVADGDQEPCRAEHASSYAASTGPPRRRAIHPNEAARKKSQAARLLAGRSPENRHGGVTLSSRSARPGCAFRR